MGSNLAGSFLFLLFHLLQSLFNKTNNLTKMDDALAGGKRFFRIGRQAVLQKLGKAQKAEEDPAFRANIDQFRAVNGSFKEVSKAAQTIVNQETSVAVAGQTAAVAYRTMASKMPDTPLAGLVSDLAASHDQLDAFRDEFTRSAREGPLNHLAGLTTTFDETIAVKKRYNTVRLEHDAIKTEHDKLLAKAATTQSAAERLARVQSEYGASHEAYTAFQADFNALAAYGEQRVKREAGLQLIKVYREMTAFYGQAYRILTEMAPGLEQLERSILDNTDMPVEPSLSAAATYARHLESALLGYCGDIVDEADLIQQYMLSHNAFPVSEAVPQVPESKGERESAVKPPITLPIGTPEGPPPGIKATKAAIKVGPPPSLPSTSTGGLAPPPTLPIGTPASTTTAPATSLAPPPLQSVLSAPPSASTGSEVELPMQSLTTNRGAEDLFSSALPSVPVPVDVPEANRSAMPGLPALDSKLAGAPIPSLTASLDEAETDRRGFPPGLPPVSLHSSLPTEAPVPLPDVPQYAPAKAITTKPEPEAVSVPEEPSEDEAGHPLLVRSHPLYPVVQASVLCPSAYALQDSVGLAVVESLSRADSALAKDIDAFIKDPCPLDELDEAGEMLFPTLSSLLHTLSWEALRSHTLIDMSKVASVCMEVPEALSGAVGAKAVRVADVRSDPNGSAAKKCTVLGMAIETIRHEYTHKDKKIVEAMDGLVARYLLQPLRESLSLSVGAVSCLLTMVSECGMRDVVVTSSILSTYADMGERHIGSMDECEVDVDLSHINKLIFDIEDPPKGYPSSVVLSVPAWYRDTVSLSEMPTEDGSLSYVVRAAPDTTPSSDVCVGALSAPEASPKDQMALLMMQISLVHCLFTRLYHEDVLPPYIQSLFGHPSPVASATEFARIFHTLALHLTPPATLSLVDSCAGYLSQFIQRPEEADNKNKVHGVLKELRKCGLDLVSVPDALDAVLRQCALNIVQSMRDYHFNTEDPTMLSRLVTTPRNISGMYKVASEGVLDTCVAEFATVLVLDPILGAINVKEEDPAVVSSYLASLTVGDKARRVHSLYSNKEEAASKQGVLMARLDVGLIFCGAFSLKYACDMASAEEGRYHKVRTKGGATVGEVVRAAVEGLHLSVDLCLPKFPKASAKKLPRYLLKLDDVVKAIGPLPPGALESAQEDKEVDRSTPPVTQLTDTEVSALAEKVSPAPAPIAPTAPVASTIAPLVQPTGAQSVSAEPPLPVSAPLTGISLLSSGAKTDSVEVRFVCTTSASVSGSTSVYTATVAVPSEGKKPCSPSILTALVECLSKEGALPKDVSSKTLTVALHESVMVADPKQQCILSVDGVDEVYVKLHMRKFKRSDLKAVIERCQQPGVTPKLCVIAMPTVLAKKLRSTPSTPVPTAAPVSTAPPVASAQKVMGPPPSLPTSKVVGPPPSLPVSGAKTGPPPSLGVGSFVPTVPSVAPYTPINMSQIQMPPQMPAQPYPLYPQQPMPQAGFGYGMPPFSLPGTAGAVGFGAPVSEAQEAFDSRSSEVSRFMQEREERERILVKEEESGPALPPGMGAPKKTGPPPSLPIKTKVTPPPSLPVAKPVVQKVPTAAPVKAVTTATRPAAAASAKSKLKRSCASSYRCVGVVSEVIDGYCAVVRVTHVDSQPLSTPLAAVWMGPPSVTSLIKDADIDRNVKRPRAWRPRHDDATGEVVSQGMGCHLPRVVNIAMLEIDFTLKLFHGILRVADAKARDWCDYSGTLDGYVTGVINKVEEQEIFVRTQQGISLYIKHHLPGSHAAPQGWRDRDNVPYNEIGRIKFGDVVSASVDKFLLEHYNQEVNDNAIPASVKTLVYHGFIPKADPSKLQNETRPTPFQGWVARLSQRNRSSLPPVFQSVDNAGLVVFVDRPHRLIPATLVVAQIRDKIYRDSIDTGTPVALTLFEAAFDLFATEDSQHVERTDQKRWFKTTNLGRAADMLPGTIIRTPKKQEGDDRLINGLEFQVTHEESALTHEGDGITRKFPHLGLLKEDGLMHWFQKPVKDERRHIVHAPCVELDASPAVKDLVWTAIRKGCRFQTIVYPNLIDYPQVDGVKHNLHMVQYGLRFWDMIQPCAIREVGSTIEARSDGSGLYQCHIPKLPLFNDIQPPG
ncbi:hypothetical protein KIPB_002111 [Kipferlia bialata]|uniref:Uncharacterized protein n=1 Tax=Kipferlia bialata TaxID=797122 RepID=A0A9K3GGF3_9EUKA|nr:hypothetical protein KIPB_002111 [Kipferlia bialata]|eukprot:g2111.t1